MKIAIFLSFKESMAIHENAGQAERFLNYYLMPYSEVFEKIYVFSWADESFDFPFKNVSLLPNTLGVSPYGYNLILPFIHKKKLKDCQVIRLMQFTSIVPAAISKLFYKNKIIATYGFPYSRFLNVRGHRMQSLIWTAVEWTFLPVVDQFIATYQKTADYLFDRSVSPEKIRILPNGVDVDFFRPVLKKRTGIKMELLFVGRFEPEKNIINLAKSLSLIKSSDFHITLIGKGALEKDLRRILDEGHVSYEIIPRMSHDRLVIKYQSADVFLLPSLAEGYPKVLIEAMACGLPCVVGKYPGYSDIITDGNNGLVCGFDPQSIAEAIGKLLADTEIRERLSFNSREFVEKNNDIKKLVTDEIRLMEKMT